VKEGALALRSEQCISGTSHGAANKVTECCVWRMTARETGSADGTRIKPAQTQTGNGGDSGAGPSLGASFNCFISYSFEEWCLLGCYAVWFL
jgi:hypothetical protein